MKRGTLMLLAILCAACLTANADAPVFGNYPNGSGSYNISDFDGTASTAFAVGFTPSETIELSSVTLWLSNYTGQNGVSAYCTIRNNADVYLDFPGSATNGPSPSSPPVATFNAPAFNDGSLAPLTFSVQSGPVILSANTEYWLLVVATGPLFGAPYLTGSTWVGGDTPTGDAVYDGSDSLALESSDYQVSSLIPAFTINAVPEPGFGALMSLPLLLGIACKFRKNQKSRA